MDFDDDLFDMPSDPLEEIEEPGPDDTGKQVSIESPPRSQTCTPVQHSDGRAASQGTPSPGFNTRGKRSISISGSAGPNTPSASKRARSIDSTPKAAPEVCTKEGAVAVKRQVDLRSLFARKAPTDRVKFVKLPVVRRVGRPAKAKVACSVSTEVLETGAVIVDAAGVVDKVSDAQQQRVNSKGSTASRATVVNRVAVQISLAASSLDGARTDIATSMLSKEAALSERVQGSAQPVGQASVDKIGTCDPVRPPAKKRARTGTMNVPTDKARTSGSVSRCVLFARFRTCVLMTCGWHTRQLALWRLGIQQQHIRAPQDPS